VKPLKVALFSGNYNYVMDGPVRCLNRLVAFLQEEGHEVMIFAPTTDRPACKPAGTLISVPSAPLPGRSEYRLALGLPRSVRAKLEQFSPDLFHLSAPDWLGHSAQKLALRWGVPAVASFHTRFDTYARYYGGAWLEAWMTAMLTRFYNKCEHVYVPSASMIQELKTQGVTSDLLLWSRGVDRAEFDPMHRDMEWRRAAGVADDETLVVFVGRLVLEKGLDKLTEAYDRAAAETSGARIRFLVVGDGPERERLQARLPNAVFTGYLNGAPLGRAYASGDIFFNPSVTETFGNVTLEAMASGLPVVCANATGSTSIVAHGRTGFVASQPHEFYDLIRLLSEDSAGRAAMSAAARGESRRYDWDAVMRGLLGYYYDALRREDEMSPGDFAELPAINAANAAFARAASR
jgi:glycosyltransferase involved in cell wall biosynthesis